LNGNGSKVLDIVPYKVDMMIWILAKSPSMHPPQNCISYLQYSSNLSTLLHSPITYHPTDRVYSLITMSFSILA